MNNSWIDVCDVSELGEEDVVVCKHGELEIAVYHCKSGYFATDGICTHSKMGRLADGLVMGDIIECPRHQARFHIPTGEAKGAPATISLKTYELRIEGGRIFMRVEKEC